MNKVFLDTTILTNILLKTGQIKDIAQEALKKFDHSEIPVYAFKEFKAGPLAHFIYIHNKFASLGSYAKTIQALQKLSITLQRNKTSTSLEAIYEAHNSIGKMTPSELLEKYGDKAQYDKILCDEMRISIKTAIFKAWKKRRLIADEVVYPLACYEEIAPYEKRGLIEKGRSKCINGSDCFVAILLKRDTNLLKAMRNAIKDSVKAENKKRSKILKNLIRNPGRGISDNDCRAIGDAVFVFLAPDDAVILTTNIDDHKPPCVRIDVASIKN